MKKYCQNNVQTIQDYTSKPKNQRFKKFFHHSVWKKNISKTLILIVTEKQTMLS